MARVHARIAAVLLDVDGVLIDSARAHRSVWSAWARHRGLDEELVWRATFGRRPEDTVALTAPALDPVVERQLLDQLVSDHELDVVTMPGATLVISALGSTPWALVTSGSRSVTCGRFRRLGLPLPPLVVGGDDVACGKPDPECYQRAASRLGLRPSECLVIEDAPAGIAAGRAAGCYVIAVTTTCSRAECADADEVLTDLAQVASRVSELLS
jgi:sugar-phosphatase